MIATTTTSLSYSLMMSGLLNLYISIIFNCELQHLSVSLATSGRTLLCNEFWYEWCLSISCPDHFHQHVPPAQPVEELKGSFSHCWCTWLYYTKKAHRTSVNECTELRILSHIIISHTAWTLLKQCPCLVSEHGQGCCALCIYLWLAGYAMHFWTLSTSHYCLQWNPSLMTPLKWEHLSLPSPRTVSCMHVTWNKGTSQIRTRSCVPLWGVPL